jgi:uncharacterized membrane protein SpoIIM required for sporulation
MNLERFLGERQPVWTELDRLVTEAGKRPERLGPQGVRRLGTLYRGAAADLALARRRFPHDPLVRRLEALVGRARSLVYDVEVRRETLREFVVHGYWRRVVERPVFLAVSAVLLFAPFAAAVAWAHADAGAAGRMVPAPFRAVTQRSGGDLGLSLDQQAAFASQILTNNIKVTFLSFAGGIVLGFGTAAVLGFNGVLLGAVTGLAVQAGNGAPLAELVVAHGILELTCIVVAATAGLRMGWSLVDPGSLRRSEALTAESRRAVEILLGTAPWLVVAGLIEGFITPSGFGLAANLAVGCVFGALYWTLVVVLGRRTTAAPEPSL